MAVVTAFESAPTNPPYPQLPFIGPPLYSLYDPMGPEPNVSREQLMALEVDMRRAHALAQPAARARAAYKRLARYGGPAESIPAALRKATELSTERYELLHANARHARALLEMAGPGDDRVHLEFIAASTAAMAEGCDDLQLIQP
ncbi:hypothetical protein [Micrococcus luteus]|uniref:hypothetical protein n=1 Tax=Micrococcus luteus TaxID=1270 RepID=UPI000BA511DB|nr:hypothetical protein [Micrococcus luteus]PAL12561.1 hypothetical protein B8X03_11090 [Micrococcus luteus]